MRIKLNDGREVEVPDVVRIRLSDVGERPVPASEIAKLLNSARPVTPGSTAPSGIDAERLATIVALSDAVKRLTRGESVDLSFLHAAGAGTGEGEGEGDALPTVDVFEVEVGQLRKEQPSLSLHDAAAIVQGRNPDAWHRHREILAGCRLPKIVQNRNRHLDGAIY